MSEDATVRRWRRTGICVLAQEAGESYRAHGEARNPVMAGGKKSHAKADRAWAGLRARLRFGQTPRRDRRRSEEHTSELQSRLHLVCRLLLEKKKTQHERRESKRSDN